uniref:Uncharacterized protein n=1 Tax=Arundo donax TaxID=35708 RepID=A0A0A9GWI5_ARUDO
MLARTTQFHFSMYAGLSCLQNYWAVVLANAHRFLPCFIFFFLNFIRKLLLVNC